MQTDRSTLIAFMRSIKTQNEYTQEVTLGSAPVPQMERITSPEPRLIQNDRTTLRAAMDRMPEGRDSNR